MSSTVFDDRIYSIVPQSSFTKIQAAFLTDLCQPTQELPINMDPLWSAWCRFAFSVIVFGGVAGHRFFEELLNLQWRHIDNIHDGYLLVPRWGGQVPLYVDEKVICPALSLRILTLKSHPRKTIREPSFLPKEFLIPEQSKSEARLSQTEAAFAMEQFTRWLDGLRQRAQIEEKITPSRLIQLSRGRLIQIYDPVIVGAILGLHRYNPAPVSQLLKFGIFQHSQPLHLEDPCNHLFNEPEDPPYRPRLPILHQELQHQSPLKPLEPDLPPSFNKIRKIVTLYSRSDKKSAQRSRSRVLTHLRSHISRMEQELEKRWTLDWNEYPRSLGQSLPLWKIEAINTVLISHWMVRLIRRSPPNTVEGRLNDLATFLRVGNLGLLPMLKESDLEKIINGLDISARSKERMTSTIRSFFQFLKSSLEISVPEIGLWHIGWVNSVNEYPLLFPDDFEAILVRIDSGRSEVLAAALLSFFFGLRISEVCSLSIGHILFGFSPTVFVMRSKRGKSRFIEGIEIPPDEARFLEEFRADRLKQVGGDLAQPLLVNAKGDPISRQSLSRLWRKAVCSTEINHTWRQSFSTFHSLRHACANRWLALGVPLVEIARMLGHSSIDTTVRSYIHCFHFIQKDQIEKFAVQQKELRFTSKGVARLLGVTPRRARQILVENQVVFIKEGRKRYYSIDPVLDLLIRYPLQSEG